MKPAPFAYKKVRTLKEAVALLAKHKDNARLLAGGQSLIATLNMRLSAPALLIDINGIRGSTASQRRANLSRSVRSRVMRRLKGPTSSLGTHR